LLERNRIHPRQLTKLPPTPTRRFRVRGAVGNSTSYGMNIYKDVVYTDLLDCAALAGISASINLSLPGMAYHVKFHSSTSNGIWSTKLEPHRNHPVGKECSTRNRFVRVPYRVSNQKISSKCVHYFWSCSVHRNTDNNHSIIRSVARALDGGNTSDKGRETATQ